MEPTNRQATKIYIITSNFSNLTSVQNPAGTHIEIQPYSNWRPSWRVHVNSEKRILASLFLAVCKYVPTRLPLDVFP
jgi:hypothetical protein